MSLAGTWGCFSMSLLLSASVLSHWLPQGAQAALRIQQIPEQPQKNQDLLLSVQGVPSTFQDFIWYLGEEADGGTRLFTYIPGLQRPQRDGNAMGQRDIVGFPNGSMLLRDAQPSDSGTYQVAITINPAWTMKAKTTVRVAEKQEDLPTTTASLPMNTGIVVAAIVGLLATGALLVGSVLCLLVTKGRRGPRVMPAGKPELSPHPNAGDIYEVMPSPVPLESPLSGVGPMNSATPPALPPPLQPEPESHHYQVTAAQASGLQLPPLWIQALDSPRYGGTPGSHSSQSPSGGPSSVSPPLLHPQSYLLSPPPGPAEPRPRPLLPAGAHILLRQREPGRPQGHTLQKGPPQELHAMAVRTQHHAGQGRQRREGSDGPSSSRSRSAVWISEGLPRTQLPALRPQRSTPSPISYVPWGGDKRMAPDNSPSKLPRPLGPAPPGQLQPSSKFSPSEPSEPVTTLSAWVSPSPSGQQPPAPPPSHPRPVWAQHVAL